MIWATRPGIHIDRAASAWLITTYVDDDAEFVYIHDVEDLPVGATAFDMLGCDLTHHGSDVTFETILRRYELHDPVLWQIAEIVHQADVEDDKYDAPEAAGFDTLIRALSDSHDDETVRTLSATLFDSLYSYFRQDAVSDGPIPSSR